MGQKTVVTNQDFIPMVTISFLKCFLQIHNFYKKDFTFIRFVKGIILKIRLNIWKIQQRDIKSSHAWS